MIDIGRIAAAALAQASTLLPNWLADGRWDGVEWRCGDLTGGKGSSFACNSKTGRWSDFASGEAGGDLVSLYAAIHRLRQGEAAREVALEKLQLRSDSWGESSVVGEAVDIVGALK